MNLFHRICLKNFLEDILSGNTKDNEVEDYKEGINNIEKKLNKLIKSENNDKLKNYIKKNKLFSIWKR